MAENFNGLFGTMSIPKTEEKKSFVPDYEYKVSFQDGKNGIYTSVIRFVPWYQDTNKNIMTKKVSWVCNPATKQKKPVDNPSSIGETKNPISNMFWALHNSNDERLKKLGADNLSTSSSYAAVVQIIDDIQRPELKGKLMIMRFGKKIYDKIMDEWNPTTGYGVGICPFDIFDGRLFVLKVGSQNGNNNYDQSNFMDIKSAPKALRYKNAKGEFVIADENSNQAEIYEYLKTETPDLSQYDYHEWDAETAKYVDDTLKVIQSYINGGDIPDMTETAIGNVTINSAPIFPGVSSSPVSPQQKAYPKNEGSVNGISAMPNILNSGLNAPSPTDNKVSDNAFGDIESLL